MQDPVLYLPVITTVFSLGFAAALLRRRTAHALTACLGTVVGVAAACVLASPLNPALAEAHRLSGKVLVWAWVRAFSPFINTYALVFLVGGAVLSAVRFSRRRETHHRFVGNVLIAVGALLPGIGGAFTRFGYVEVLYVTELIGLSLIYLGYRFSVGGPLPAVAGPAVRQPAA